MIASPFRKWPGAASNGSWSRSLLNILDCHRSPADADSHTAAVRKAMKRKNSYHSRQTVIKCHYENGNR